MNSRHPDAEGSFVESLLEQTRELTSSLSNLSTGLDLDGADANELKALSGLLSELGSLEMARMRLERSFQLRQEGRSKFRGRATVRFLSSTIEAEVRDVSAHGAGLTLDTPLEAAVTIPFDGVHVTQHGTLRWNSGHELGFEFPDPESILHPSEDE